MLRSSSFKILLLAGLSVSALSACAGGSQTQEAKSSVPRPPVDNIGNEGQSLAASDTVTPIMEQAPEGENTEERMARLERSINELQADYQRIMPAFASLNTTNERIQTLLSEIEQQAAVRDQAAGMAPMKTLNTATTVTTTQKPVVSAASANTSILTPGAVSTVRETTTTTTSAVYPEADMAAAATTTQAAPPLSAFANQPTTEEARAEAARQTGVAENAASVAPAAAPSSASSSIKALRIGEHNTKTRLVFDMTGKEKPEVTYDIDSAEKLMLVQLPSSSWNAAKAGSPNSPLIANWAAQDTPSGGTAVAIQLKKGAKIVSSEYLKAEGGNPARLVVDIAAGG